MLSTSTLPMAPEAPVSLKSAPTNQRARAPYRPSSHRRILCVAPPYAKSFGTFHHAYPMVKVRAFMPPQGILVMASYLPKEWEVRFVDENVRPARDADFRWADVVFITGMHVQRPQINRLNDRAHQFGKLTVLGGPSVSGAPEWYPGIDLIHVGELGDATDALIERLDKSVEWPNRQESFTTNERLPLEQFPLPAYHLVDLRKYFLASIQFSSGCPYRCEFCDIPELYGRNPRLKTPEQVVAELDAMLARSNPGAVYFVDDNFIGNKKAALGLLKALVRWQEERGFPVEFACEATLNLAQAPDVLELMRQARFHTVFCGIETPEENALEFMQKKQNLRQPILEAVRTLNDYGMEVVSGIIVGLDTDTPSTGDRIVKFIELSAIPLLTINVLHALPKTPLWRRLEAANRIVRGEGRESNVDFLLPYETVVDMWQQCIREAYMPEAVFARYEHQIRHTFPKRRSVPITPARVNVRNVMRGIGILTRVIWHVGWRADYRKRFWQMAVPELKKGNIDNVIHAAIVSHHLITFSRECLRGEAEKCFYGERSVEPRAAEAA